MRVRKTIPQKSLGRKEREINLKNAFKTSTNALELKKVLLVDDIYTTGVTMDEAAKVLWMAGAEEVHFSCALYRKTGLLRDTFQKPDFMLY